VTWQNEQFVHLSKKDIIWEIPTLNKSVQSKKMMSNMLVTDDEKENGKTKF
jgi:hypothetical protein